MKKGYKKLLFFEAIILLVLLLNSFVVNINGYGFIIFLAITLILFKFLFGFEKDKQRYLKDLIMEVIIFLFVFFILFYILGLIIGFIKIRNYYTFEGIKNFIIPVILLNLLKEFLRYMMLKKSENNLLLNITTCILFIFLDISNAIYYTSFNTFHDLFIFLALVILPAMSKNIVFTIMSVRTGYKPIMIYVLTLGLYAYLIPVIPSPSEYLTSVINVFLPAILGYRIYLFYRRTADDEIPRDYNKKRFIFWIFPAVIVIILVYFTSGYFHYHAIAVGSGSMVPEFDRGDVVVIEKIDAQYDSLKVGQVIAFKYNNIIIVHRLVRIVKSSEHYYFYTKGDANNEEDGYAIGEEMVIGTVNVKIPLIGYPTVWLNEL